MTLAQRCDRYEWAVRIFLALSVLDELALLVWWASQLGEMTWLPAALHLRSLPLNALALIGVFGLFGLLHALVRADKFNQMKAALTRSTDIYPLAKPEFSEGEESVNQLVKLSWNHDESPLLVMAAPAFFFCMALLDPVQNWMAGIGFLVLLIGIGIPIWIVVKRRALLDTVEADEQGIRMWRMGVEGPLLLWSNVRLLLVGSVNVFQEYQVYDKYGRMVWWRGTTTPSAIRTESQQAHVANARALIWLAQAKTGLEWRADRSAYEISGRVMIDPQGKDPFPFAFVLCLALLVAFLALATLPFRSAYSPMLNVVSAVSLSLLALSLSARSCWRILTWRTASATQVDTAPTPSASRWLIAELSLAFIGGALGSITFTAALFSGSSASSWILGGLYAEIGLPIAVAIAAYSLYHIWRNNQGAPSIN